MKNSLFLLVFLVAVLSSCSPDDDTDLVSIDDTCDYTPAYLDSIYHNVGQIHNDGLEYAYNHFEQNKTIYNYGANFSDVKNIVYDSVFSYSSLPDSLDGFEPIDSLILDPDISFYDHVNRIANVQISSTLNSAASSTKYVIDNYFYESSLNSKLDSLKDHYLPLISDCTEKIALVGMLSVAKSSCEYWKNEGSKWADLSADSTITSRWEGNAWTDAAWADAAGAGMGALYGAYVGLTGGTVALPIIGTAVGGAGGVLVGMISGAISGSVISGLHSVAKWIVGWG